MDVFWFLSLVALFAVIYPLVTQWGKLTETASSYWDERFKVTQSAFGIIAAIGFLLWVIIVVIAFVRLIDVLALAHIDKENYRLHYLAFVGLATFFVAIATAPLALVRLSALLRQTKTQEENLLTDRINKAVEGLGAEKTVKVTEMGEDGTPVSIENSQPNIEVRIGAIYALERIARDNLEVHIQIMEILCAYIRENAPASEVNIGRDAPRADVQTALTVIGRRSRAQKELEWGKWRPFGERVPDWPIWTANEDGRASEQYNLAVADYRKALSKWKRLKPDYRLDLRNTNLMRASMHGHANKADFSLALFNGAILERASFYKAKLQSTNFRDTNVHGADFSDAEAQGSEFNGATANEAIFQLTKLQGTKFAHAKLQNVDFSDAHAQSTSFINANLKETTFFHARIQCSDFGLALAVEADFSWTIAHGADFSRGIFSERTDFEEAKLTAAALKCDISMVYLTQDQVNSTFGDQSTKLPHSIQYPKFWPKWRMPHFSSYSGNDLTFLKQWKKWQRQGEAYVPPPKPDDYEEPED